MVKLNVNFTSAFLNAWHSPILMTWGSLLVRVLGLALLLPLILSRFSTEDVVVWQLFSAFILLLIPLDMGFTPTFSRFISYGMGGLTINEISRVRNQETKSDKTRESDWKTIGLVMVGMRRIYAFMGLITFLVLLILGTWAVSTAISKSSDPGAHWIAWAVMVVSCSTILFGNYYVAFLQGTNQIAVLQRFRILSSLMAVAAASLVVVNGGGLLAVVVTYQILMTANVFINMLLVKKLNQSHVGNTESNKEHPHIWEMVWDPAWKSGLGIALTAGLIQLSGIAYAQLASVEQVATYLLTLQLIRSIGAFAQAPFYTTLPILTRRYAEKNLDDLIKIGRTGMRRSYLVYVAGFLITGLLAPVFLDLINSSVEFPDIEFWSLVGLAFFFERFGAMHLQLYSVTNHIVWHIANGLAGVIMLVSVFILYPIMSVWSFPVAVLTGYLGFYAWYSARLSYREFNQKFVRFEKTLALPALFALCLGTAGLILV